MSENGNGSSARSLDVVGTFEAHLILGVERSRIARFLEENRKGLDKIPLPDATPRCGPIWRRRRIEQRAARMYAEAGHPHGDSQEGLDRWIVERAMRRAAAAGLPLESEDARAELEEILRRPLPVAA
jgi:hypothetical protein